MTNSSNKVLYIGVTNNLIKRIYQHKEKLELNSFTAKYNVNKLVYFEIFNDINSAISREKQLKAGNRSRKINLIDQANPLWHDLYDKLI